MKGLNKKDQKTIEQAVQNAQKENKGEVVPVILSSSDIYSNSHFRLSILLCALTPLLVYALPLIELDPLWSLTLSFPAALAGYLLAYIPALKRTFSTSKEFRESVHQKACEMFFQKRLHSSPDRASIMLFISRLERRIEILADVGINEKISSNRWDEITSLFIQKQHQNPKKKRSKWDTQLVVKGLVEVIEECGTLLNQHFPQTSTPEVTEAETETETKTETSSSSSEDNGPESHSTQPQN